MVWAYMARLSGCLEYIVKPCMFEKCADFTRSNVWPSLFLEKVA